MKTAKNNENNSLINININNISTIPRVTTNSAINQKKTKL